MAKKQAKLPFGALGQDQRTGRYFFTQENLDYPISNLTGIQHDSYKKFIEEGIWEELQGISPIEDMTGRALSIEFLSSKLEKTKYTPAECRAKNLTYEAALHVRVQLTNKKTGEIKEQDIYMGEMPMMTKKGTFVINGIERVVVNQIQRAPGIYIGPSPLAPKYFAVKAVPYRGAWLEVETNKNNILTLKVDRKRKMYLTAFLKAFGMSEKDIIEAFADVCTPEMEDFITPTIEKDPTGSRDEAILHLYKKLRPGDMADVASAWEAIEKMFFNIRRYDIGRVGLHQLSRRFDKDIEDTEENRVFNVERFVEIIKLMIRVNQGTELPDDVDSLAMRRVRSCGELLKERFGVGLMRTERIVKDRMLTVDAEQVTPQQLINPHPIVAQMREFMASSALSQFLDQLNPLAELSHKRQVTATGPGGLNKERAGFDVRDLHLTHYGRVCPVTTPEGQNVGLVNRLATYAKVNEYGFLETPYREIKRTIPNDGKNSIGRRFWNIGGDIIKAGNHEMTKDEIITEKLAKELAKNKKLKNIPVRPFIGEGIQYYDVRSELKMTIAQSNEKINEMSEFEGLRIPCRQGTNPVVAHISDVTHVDVSARQIFSVEASLNPFMECDDDARALMAANMQRQAVPCIKNQAPLVGTGMEYLAAADSGQVLCSDVDGEVTYVDSTRIEIIAKDGSKQTLNLERFNTSNQSTLLDQRPIVDKGDKVKVGDIIADASATDHGELSLGRNLTVAFMPWRGYNFEDAIVMSEDIYRSGIFNSVHIEEFACDVRDTKLGAEEVTRDIPNTPEEKLANLDEDGIVTIGSYVKGGDILVGKITPKGETELTPEERLLRAIFGEKAHDVKDTSKIVPIGMKGKVINVKVNTPQDTELPQGVIKQVKVSIARTKYLSVGDKMAGRHGNKGVISTIVPSEDMPYLPDGTRVDIVLTQLGIPSRMNIGQVLESMLGIAAQKLNIKVASPVINGPKVAEISRLMKEAGLPEDGKTTLYDGVTGEPFDSKVNVGVMYVMKLNHLVDDKSHARSIGPYSIVTQQPLGGKAQGGGQRFGEMEVWALEAHGAAHTLREMLTYKSDDVRGRLKAYEALVRGEDINIIGRPAGFDVLVNELRACGIKVNMAEADETGRAKIEDSDNFATEDEVMTETSEEITQDMKEHTADHDAPVILGEEEGAVMDDESKEENTEENTEKNTEEPHDESHEPSAEDLKQLEKDESDILAT